MTTSVTITVNRLGQNTVSWQVNADTNRGRLAVTVHVGGRRVFNQVGEAGAYSGSGTTFGSDRNAIRYNADAKGMVPGTERALATGRLMVGQNSGTSSDSVP